MKKKIIKEELSEATGADVPACDSCKCSISKLDITFQNVDMNKVVDKINEIIEKHDSI